MKKNNVFLLLMLSLALPAHGMESDIDSQAPQSYISWVGTGAYNAAASAARYVRDHAPERTTVKETVTLAYNTVSNTASNVGDYALSCLLDSLVFGVTRGMCDPKFRNIKPETEQQRQARKTALLNEQHADNAEEADRKAHEDAALKYRQEEEQVKTNFQQEVRPLSGVNLEAFRNYFSDVVPGDEATINKRIDKKYKELMLQHHSDKHPNTDEETSKNINAARDTWNNHLKSLLPEQLALLLNLDNGNNNAGASSSSS